MAIMIRPYNKATKIAWSLIGKPITLAQPATKKQQMLTQRTLRNFTVYAQ